MRAHRFAAACALVAAACSGHRGGESTNSRIAGIWQVVSGPVIPGADMGTPTFLELHASGQAQFHARSSLIGIAACADSIFAVLSPDEVTFDVPTIPTSTGDPLVFLDYTISGDTLTLTDPLGGTVTTLTRTTAIPAADACNELSAPAVTSLGSNNATSRTGLASDGVDLWYTDELTTSWIRFDPLAGAGTAVPIPTPVVGQWRYVAAMETAMCGRSASAAAPRSETVEHIGHARRFVRHRRSSHRSVDGRFAPLRSTAPISGSVATTAPDTHAASWSGSSSPASRTFSPRSSSSTPSSMGSSSTGPISG